MQCNLQEKNSGLSRILTADGYSDAIKWLNVRPIVMPGCRNS